MAIKMPEKTWLTFHELMERWQCTENDIRRLVIEQSLIPSIRTGEKLTMPDWEFASSGEFEPSGRWGENSGDGCAYEETVLHHWLYLRNPVRISTFDCEFRLASFQRDSPEPKEPDRVVVEGLSWYWIPKTMTLKNVIGEAAFLLKEVSHFEAKYTNQAQEDETEKALTTNERNTLLKLVIGMAIVGYGYNPNSAKSTTPKEIVNDLSGLGINISDDTVRKYLKEGATTVLPKKQHKS